MIDVLVIHSISLPPGGYGAADVESFFLNHLNAQSHPFYQSICDLRVSSHLFIKRNGELVQFVPLGERAWHAGVSEFEGRARVNDFSIGIELEGSDYVPFEEKQYETLFAVTAAIRSAYPAITPDRVVGHNQIAPQRKTDPGLYFNWTRYRLAMEREVTLA